MSEAKEHLARVIDVLLELERSGNVAAPGRIEEIFRAIHCVKGGAGYLGCGVIESVAHAMEDALESARWRNETPPAAGIDVLLEGADRIQALLDDAEKSGEADVGDLLVRLRALDGKAPQGPPGERGPNLAAPSRSAGAAPAGSSSLAASDFALPGKALAERPAADDYLYGVKVDLLECHRKTGLNPLAAIERLEAAGTILNACLEVPDVEIGFALGSVPLGYRAILSSLHPPEKFGKLLDLPGAVFLRLEPVTRPDERSPGAAAEAPHDPTPGAPPGGSVRAVGRAGTIRISVPLVDRLMTLAGELVLARNQLVCSLDTRDSGLRSILQRLDVLTGEMREAVTQTRLQPLGNVFAKFPRMVRDLAKEIEKRIEIEVSGAEVELDQAVLEAVSDPLTHLVRNSCDHGIEAPEERSRAGKPPAGRVLLSARQQGGQIFIEVRDDGRGIDLEAVRRKAIERGLRTPEELERLEEKDVLSLILLPGFSTARAVTDLSGRGVGMDVVKTNLDRLGGSLEIQSEPGRGTVFTLRVPLTLAIIPCLIISSDDQRFAVPQRDLEELLWVHPDKIGSFIERAFDQEVLRRRGALLPLVRLDEVCSRPEPFTASTRSEILRKHGPAAAKHGPAAGPILPFTVMKSGSRRYALAVDGVLGTEEIVVKPLHSSLRGLSCFSGATILGDGHVALILNTEGIARHAGVLFGRAAEERRAPAALEPEAAARRVLLFKYGPSEQFAVCLETIRRLALVRMERLELVGKQDFIAIDGVPTAVLHLDRILPVSPCSPRREMFLLLPKGPERRVGLLASSIIDTEIFPPRLDAEALRADGVAGAAILRGQMTMVLDFPRLIERLDSAAPLAGRNMLSRPPRRILVVEDTQFVREIVKKYLQAEGHEVVTAAHGAEALERLETQTFDLVVSDIEMPVMNGWEFARALRSRPNGTSIPLLALTTLASESDRARAREAGFDGLEVKLEHGRFVDAVAALLEKGREAG